MEDVPNLGETWFALSKVDFDEFVVGADDCQVHDNLVAVDPSQLAKFCPSKWKIIIELVHQALYFCKDRKILFEGAKLLVALLELELKHLANSDANRAADSETTLERMTKKVSLDAKKIGLQIQTVKNVLEFFTEKFLKNIEAYRYVIHYFPDEVDEVVIVEVQTPVLPLPLNSGVPP